MKKVAKDPRGIAAKIKNDLEAFNLGDYYGAVD